MHLPRRHVVKATRAELRPFSIALKGGGAGNDGVIPSLIDDDRTDRHNFPRHVDKLVPGKAAVIQNVFPLRQNWYESHLPNASAFEHDETLATVSAIGLRAFSGPR